jgi:hypothetical protein
MKWICRRTIFISGFCVVSTYRIPSGASWVNGTSRPLPPVTVQLRGMAQWAKNFGLVVTALVHAS